MDGDETATLEEMLKWLKFMGMQEAHDVIERALSYEDEKKEEAAKIAYQLTNGANSTKDISSHISFGYQWVSDRQQEWATQGLVEKPASNASYRHILTLDELGIDYPDIPRGDDE
jgi:predicted DNA-binding ArsR family transcriptional regulator